MTKQRCFQIPVGPGALDESDLCKLLAQHGIRYWVNDVAVETVHGITRPVYTLPPPEPCEPLPSMPIVCRQCGSTDTMPWPQSSVKSQGASRDASSEEK